MADPLPFTLLIEALPTGRYRLSVTSSPVGTDSTEIAAPFSFGDLAHWGDRLEGRAGLSVTERNLAERDFGETLFKAIFTGPIADIYAKSRVNAAQPLEITVQLDKAGLLANVPWELLRDPTGAALQVTALPPISKPYPVGGLQEAMLKPRMIIIVAVLFVIVGLAAIAYRVIFAAPPSDVNVVVTSLRFLPSQPAPGEQTTVAITFLNKGTTDAGNFHWAWYENGDPTQPADLKGQVTSLPAGTSLTFKSSFIFGWWGPYNTLVQVDTQHELPENPANTTNGSLFAHGLVTTSNAPFVINWTFLPDTTLIIDPKDLTGTEFEDWGLTVKADTSQSDTPPACAKAVPHIAVQMDQNDQPINQLTVSLPGGQSTSGCASVPVVFSLAHGIGSVSLDFVSPSGGSYTLTVMDASGKTIGSATADKVQAGAETVLTVPNNNSTLPPTSSVQIRLSGSPFAINTMTLGRPAG